MKPKNKPSENKIKELELSKKIRQSIADKMNRYINMATTENYETI